MRPIDNCATRFAVVLLIALAASAQAGDALLEFSEKQVAGTLDDALIARHLRMRGSQRAIGRKLAEIAQTRHRVELQGGHGDITPQRWQFYRKHFPSHYQRAVGAAEWFGAPADGPVDAMALLFNMDVAPGCSVAYYPPAFTAAGHPILSRNYDFTTATWAEFRGAKPGPGSRPCTGDVYVIEAYPDEGYPTLFLCAYDLLGGALDGINSRGLTVALLANHEEEGAPQHEPTGGWRPGLSEVEIARFVLDRCANVAEARAALMSIDYYYSFVPCHYIIGDAAGDSFVWEYGVSDGKRYAVEGAGRPQVVTNHALYRYAAGGGGPARASNTFRRYNDLTAAIAAAPQARSIDEIKKANACAAACAPPPPGRKPARTLWHALYDCTALSLDIDFYLGESATGQRRSGYLHFELSRTPGKN